MLVNEVGRVLIGKRVDTTADAWQMPQGGLDDGENTIEALWREMYEEIGTTDADIVSRARQWLTYDFPTDLAPKLWGGRFAGQTQLWYLLRFTGTDHDIKLNVHDAEFSTVKWVPPAALPNMVIAFKRDLYYAVLREFAEPLAALRL